eukprot:206882-Amphidinium_carterae.1
MHKVGGSWQIVSQSNQQSLLELWCAPEVSLTALLATCCGGRLPLVPMSQIVNLKLHESTGFMTRRSILTSCPDNSRH